MRAPLYSCKKKKKKVSLSPVFLLSSCVSHRQLGQRTCGYCTCKDNHPNSPPHPHHPESGDGARKLHDHSEWHQNPCHGQTHKCFEQARYFTNLYGSVILEKEHRHSPNPGHAESPRHPYGEQNISSSRVRDQDNCKRILDCLDEMGDSPDPSTYSSLLELYCRSKSLVNGKLVHNHIVTHDLQYHDSLASLLVEFYCKCEALEDALSLFTEMERPSKTHTWNVVIKTLLEHGESAQAFQLYDKMQLKGVMPDKVTYISLASVCAMRTEPRYGHAVHARIAHSEFASDIILETALVNMYSKCGNLADAVCLFDGMQDRNVITWTTLITAHAQHDEKKQTLQLFYQIHQEGQVPNQVTYLNTVSACSSLSDLAEGQRIHVLMLGNEVDQNVVVRTAFANMYGKCGSPTDALEMIHEGPEQNLVTWNAIIAVLVHNKDNDKALNQFVQMQQVGMLPDKVTYVTVIDACASLAMAKQGKWIHAHLLGSDFCSHVTIGNALIDMYAKCGKLDNAKQTYVDMFEKTNITWNTLITAFAHDERGKKYALQLFYQMQQEGLLADKITVYGYFDACGSLAEGARLHACLVGMELDAFLVTALISMYGGFGSLEYAEAIFNEFHEQNVVTWNALTAAYARQGETMRALLAFDRMLWEGLTPSEATFVGILNGFTSPAFLSAGIRMHAIIFCCGYGQDNTVGNALMNMYSKCGSLPFAQIVFDQMPDRDVVSWTTIIGVYGEHGQGIKALSLFKEMLRQVEPDEVTFLNVLAACNRSGLMDDGNHWFEAMSRDYGIKPTANHYGCMIDLFGRAGRLDKAEGLIRKMPSEPTYVAWMAFLGACRYTRDVKRAEVAAKRVLETNMENHEPYVLLSNVYAASGRMEDAAQVMSMMRDRSSRSKLTDLL